MDVQLGAAIYYDSGGDSWDPTWAQDDRLYAAVNDGAGFGTLRRNIGFNQISGSDPLTQTGQLQNLMDDYGDMNAPVATDGRNWKSVPVKFVTAASLHVASPAPTPSNPKKSFRRQMWLRSAGSGVP